MSETGSEGDNPPRKNRPMRAGGRAVEGGMDFQAEVGTWIAAHLLSRMPVGGRFGVGNTALPIELRLESGEGLDDILLTQSDSGQIQIQSKTKAGISNRKDSPLGKTVDQIVRAVVTARAAGTALNPARDSAVLAVSNLAPMTLNDLERGCRAFDAGGQWSVTKAQRNKKEREALDVFETMATEAWAVHAGAAVGEDDLAEMARLFRVVRFSMNEGDDNWREASRLLGARVFGSETAGDAPLRSLKGIVRGLIGRGAPADRLGLLRELRKLGHNDLRSPDFDDDVARLFNVTNAEIARLQIHTRLPIGDGVPIERVSHAPLLAAISAGSLIVVGEPGAGKTGALVDVARDRIAAGDQVVFLSVDRFPGVAIAADLQSEIGLVHPVVETLKAVPGSGCKILLIDALDAARGGPAETVFAQLIESVRAELDADWSIIASIRTFDLKNGRRYRAAMAGSPPNAEYADPSLSSVRHFVVPRLSEADLNSAGAQAPALQTLLDAAPPLLRDLLRNVFNLSLAAQLLEDGASPESIRRVATQSDLIDAYEDRRLHSTGLQRAAAAAVGAMVHRRRLAVRKVVVDHPQLDAILQTGVLSDTGDLVSFSHHVLFDHVAGRFFLEWDDAPALRNQLQGDSSIALMLAPGLRFAIERFWRNDPPGKPNVWRFVADIYATPNVDPVLANVALRTAIENVENVDDVAGLTEIIGDRGSDEATATMLSRLARFVGLQVDSTGSPVGDLAKTWASVAEAAAAAGSRGFADAAQFLLHTLFEKADFSDAEFTSTFGRAARTLLARAWDARPPMPHTASNAIRFVGKSFASDVTASRTTLTRALVDPHFEAHADREATWLAEQIVPIAEADPTFAVEIFRVLYSRDIDDQATSYLGGQPSRILPLSSTRSQDYRMCRYNLGRRVSRLLDLSVEHGTRAVIEAALGDAPREPVGDDDRETVSLSHGGSFELVGHEYGFNSWDEPDETRGAQEDDVLLQYVAFLRNCTIDQFAESVAAAARNYSSPAVWARILGVGAERVADTADLLWPYATNPTLIAHEDTIRDAVRFIAAAYPTRPSSELEAFESAATAAEFTDDNERRWWRSALGRLLSSVDESDLSTDAMRSLRAELEAAGELRPNTPLRSMTTSWGRLGGLTRDLLARQGIDVNDGPNEKLITESEALYELVQNTPSESDRAALAHLWAAAEALIGSYDACSSELDERVERPVWGHISNAVERVAGSKAYDPGVDGLPDLEALLAILRRLWGSPFPRPRDESGDGLSWSNWDVRVYAAEAYVSLAPTYSADFPEIVDKIDEITRDPVPQVRLQAAQNLRVISQSAPDRMWAIAARIAGEEPHDGVVGSFLNHVICKFTWAEPERVETIIETVRARMPIGGTTANSRRDHVATALGGLAAQLWVWQGRSRALEWLTEWAQNPGATGDILRSFISLFRGAFFSRYATAADDDDRAISDRAQQAATIILENAGEAVEASFVVISRQDAGEEERESAISTYRSAQQVIHHLMNQLYFGSGAYREGREATIGLMQPEAMHRFLDDYEPVLTLLAESREPATHHHLVELYEHLVPGDPERVFDALHALLTGPGAREGYHFEALAVGVIVRVITRYIADYRSIFEDDTRRARLIEILRLFSDVGWPDALRLLYEIPELLR